MRIESYDYGVSVGLAGTLQRTPDHGLMTKVEPIEHADCQVR